MPPNYAYAPDASTVATKTLNYAWSMIRSAVEATVPASVAPAATRERTSGAAERIAALGQLTEEWSSYGERPNVDAVKLATDVASRLAAYGHQPHHIAPLADGGVSLRFSAGDGLARVEAYNDGDIVLVMQASAESEAEYGEAENATDAATRLAQFLGE